MGTAASLSLNHRLKAYGCIPLLQSVSQLKLAVSIFAMYLVIPGKHLASDI